MNKVYAHPFNRNPMTSEALAAAANIITHNKPFTASDFEGEDSRISGNHCYCDGEGEFLLLPVHDATVVEGEKRYMKCLKCGGYSHL